ncbi:hypothetical protein ACTA71_010340 [Dictyostelium dimigraforme]
MFKVKSILVQVDVKLDILIVMQRSKTSSCAGSCNETPMNIFNSNMSEYIKPTNSTTNGAMFTTLPIIFIRSNSNNNDNNNNNNNKFEDNDEYKSGDYKLNLGYYQFFTPNSPTILFRVELGFYVFHQIDPKGYGHNSGKAIIGIVETENGMEPTTKGDAINFAFRTKHSCKGYQSRI